MANPLSNVLKEFKALIFLLLLMVGIFAGGWFIKGYLAGGDYELLLADKNKITENLTIAKNKTTSLQNLLNGKDQRIQELKQVIANLEKSPTEVTHVVETVTTLPGEETKVIVYREAECPNPPPDHLFQLENGLKVASFRTDKESEEKTYSYETAELTLQGTVVIAEQDTAVLLKATSSLEPDITYPLRVDALEVTKIRKHRIFEPHIQINMNALVAFAPVAADVTASISVPLIHPLDKELDFLAPKIGFNNHDVRLGVDIIGYNLGHKLPVITDLWISAGTSVSLIGESKYPSVDISIGSKF